MSDEVVKVYRFQAPQFSSGGAEVNLAKVADVIDCFGGGGVKNADGLSPIFQGFAAYKDEVSGQEYLGVWGVRNCSKYRRLLREYFGKLEIVNEKPECRLTVYSSR